MMLKNLLFSFCFFAACLNQQAIAQITIAEARLQPVGTEVTVRGVVTHGSELGVIRYIQDPTAGIGLYSTTFTTTLSAGDSVEVTGTLDDFNGLLELQPISALTVIQPATTIPAFQTVENASLNESLESELVQMNGVVFSSGGNTFSANTSYTFTQGTGTGSLYVRTNSPLIGQTIPVGTITLNGICSEYNGLYQVLARTIEDFIIPAGINITSLVSVDDFQQTTATVSWETNIPGTTSILYGKTPALELGLLSDANPVTNHTYTFNGLEPGHLYYFVAFSSANGNSSSAPTKVFGTVSNSSGDMKAWFNHPVYNHPEAYLNETIDDTLIYYINQADSSIDLTIYDFISEGIGSISTAINEAWNRGVRVRFISDGNLVSTNTGVSELLAEIPKITSPTGGNYTIMHNKFVVIDANHSDPNKPLVWTGSTNWSDRQINRDPNNVILIQDQTLARTYQAEFNEMWGSSGANPDTINSKFGSQKTDNTPHEFKINGKRVECYFSPSDNTNASLIKTMKTADDTLSFATMLITRTDIRETIDTLVQSGVLVKGIINSDTTTLVYNELLLSMGNNLFVNPDTHVIMHHKFFTADAYTDSDPLVWTGSHNWSTNANTRNDENTVVVHDATIAQLYHAAYFSLANPIIEDTTGISTIQAGINFKLFPSPLSSDQTLYVIPNFSGKQTIEMFDLNGRQIQQNQVNLISGQASAIELNQAFVSGIYFLKIGNEYLKFTIAN